MSKTLSVTFHTDGADSSKIDSFIRKFVSDLQIESEIETNLKVSLKGQEGILKSGKIHLVNALKHHFPGLEIPKFTLQDLDKDSQQLVDGFSACTVSVPSLNVPLNAVDNPKSETVNNVQKWTTIEAFFDSLQTKIKNEKYIQQIRDIFQDQEITVEQIQYSGHHDLMLTDAKLKEIGVEKLGIRTAILALIFSRL